MEIKFDEGPLALEQNNYLSKVLNAYFAYELYDQPKIPLKDFTLKQ